jgi:prophage antirepressor-like protein
MSDAKPTTDLISLSFEGQPLHAFADTEDMFWWLAEDVCRILDLDNISRAVSRLDEDEKDRITNGYFNAGRRGNPYLLVVNEAGLYRLVLASRKPAAKIFKRWLLHDVLPALRKYGSYAIPGANMPQSKDGITPAPWYELRILTAQQIALFAWSHAHTESWFTTPDLVRHTGVHVATARDYARYFSRLGLWHKLHHHPLNFYRLDPLAAHHQPALVQYLLAARDLPEAALPVLPTPAW